MATLTLHPDRLFPADPTTRKLARALYDTVRIDCRFLATLAIEHRIDQDEAFDLAPKLAYQFAKQA